VALITELPALDELVEDYMACDEFAFDVETIGGDRDNPHVATVAWLSLACESRADVIPMGHPNGALEWSGPAPLLSGQRKLDAGKTYEQLRPSDLSKVKIDRRFTPAPKQLKRDVVFDALRPLFMSDIPKIGHNIKFDLHAVSKYIGGHPTGPYYDTLIASWLLDVTLIGRLSLDQCVERELGEVLVKGIGKNVAEHAFEEVARYSLLDAEYTYRLKRALDRKYAKASSQTRWLLGLEMEVLHPVIEMEAVGTRLDAKRLAEIDRDLREDIDAIRGDIFRLAGTRFNIRSNRDKQEVLFLPKSQGGLGLKGLKVTESARSKPESERDIYDFAVDHETMEHYKHKPLVAAMMLHSAKNKLHGTYVLPYLGGSAIRDADEKQKHVVSKAAKTGRIHGQFKQHGTESGRFSSSNPNLQNIPSRSEDGRKLREVFVPDPGMTLVVADYSQIEPRIVASLSGDQAMISTYNDGGDVYQMVADRMGVTRSIGKELVLSITYGVGATTISTRIGCSHTEARDLMAFFAAKFPAIPRHKNAVVSRARRDRYSTTILGRRRPLPKITWADPELRSGAERQAYNHVIQGSAADIMKIALVNIYVALPDSADMLLTVHDEVVVQVEDEDLEEVMEIVRTEMEAAKPRSIYVPLVAEVSSGTNWGSAKP
jgi:DNA polymerase-1